MREKKEIVAKLKGLLAWKVESRGKCKEVGIPSSLQRMAMTIADSQIRTLRWVLKYKIYSPYYWCFSCQLMHRDIKCPKCGSDRVIE